MPLFRLSSALNMSHIIATIDEHIINFVLAKADPIEGEEYREAEPVTVPYIGIGTQETPLGVKVPFPCRKEKTIISWKMKLKWSIKNLRVEILDDLALFKADVHAKSDTFSYTESATSSFKVSIKKTTLFVTLQPLKVTLYIKPENTKINILTFDIIEKLPPELKHMKFFLPFTPNLEIPMPGGEKLVLDAKSPVVSLRRGCIVASISLEQPTFWP